MTADDRYDTGYMAGWEDRKNYDIDFLNNLLVPLNGVQPNDLNVSDIEVIGLITWLVNRIKEK